MTYVIYERETKKIVSTPTKTEYKTMSAARAALTRINKTWVAANSEKLKTHPDLIERAPLYQCGLSEINYYQSHLCR